MPRLAALIRVCQIYWALLSAAAGLGKQTTNDDNEDGFQD